MPKKETREAVFLSGSRPLFYHHKFTWDQDWIRGASEGRGGPGARSQVPESSVGEEKAVLLGFFMMAFSVLMFFVVGITTVKPFVNSKWEEHADCVLLQTLVPDEWVDCRGVSEVPCLRARVNLSSTNQEAFLHLDEEPPLLFQCFYIPKCHMERKSVEEEVMKVKISLDQHVGISSWCLSDPSRHPNHVILNRKFTLSKALLALLWPCLMLGGGALLVGLVKLTQCLAHVCAEVSSEAAGERHAQTKVYRLMRRSSLRS
uniref:Si:ch211-38m6.7 n=1 Tax=Gouania willdenowi TaxID=441366 RepID=A0A8C5ERS0_GOUWI